MFLPKSLDEAILWLDQHGVKGVTVNELLRLGAAGCFQICAPILQEAYSPTINARNIRKRNNSGIYDFDINEAHKEATKQLFGLYPLYKPTLFELDIKRTVNVTCVGDLKTEDMYFVSVDVSVDELRVTSQALENLLSRCKTSQQTLGNQTLTLPVIKAEIEKPKTKGMAKRPVMRAFDGILFDYDHWGKRLSTPPKWLIPCRIAKGSKKASSTWNPVLIALALMDQPRLIPIKRLDLVFIGLKDWKDEWQEKTDLMR